MECWNNGVLDHDLWTDAGIGPSAMSPSVYRRLHQPQYSIIPILQHSNSTAPSSGPSLNQQLCW
jgi:hypothetical protein